MANYRNTILLGLSLVLMVALIMGTSCQQEESTEITLMVGNATGYLDAIVINVWLHFTIIKGVISQ